MTFALLKSGRVRRIVLAYALASVVVWFAASYPRGMLMAYIDHVCGHYEEKGWGYPAPWRHEYIRLLRERYGVEEDIVGDCMLWPTTEMYAEGCNDASGPLLVRKYGKDNFAECAAVAKQEWHAQHPDE